MRGLFILLLASNVALLLWQSFQTGSEESIDSHRTTVPVVNEGLTLISELDRTQRPPLHEAQEDALSSAGIGHQETNVPASAILVNETGEEGSNKDVDHALCLQVDEIDSEAAYQQLLDILEANGAKVIKQGEAQGSKTNYWVMLPPYRNRAKADEAAAMLSAKRINDFFIVRSGEYENAVSLRVFSERERAERRYDQIVSLKQRLRKPKIETIALPAKHYFVMFDAVDMTVQRVLLERLRALDYPSATKVECK